MDISKYFRESLGLQDNESQLCFIPYEVYIFIALYKVFIFFFFVPAIPMITLKAHFDGKKKKKKKSYLRAMKLFTFKAMSQGYKTFFMLNSA